MEIEASEVAVEDGAPTLEQLTKVYIKIRDNRRVLEQAFKVEDEKLQEQIRAIEEQMLDICKKFNASSIKTEAGTIIRSVKSRYWTNDCSSLKRIQTLPPLDSTWIRNTPWLLDVLKKVRKWLICN